MEINMLQPFYASSEINRHGNQRNNQEFLEKIMLNPSTKFIPVKNGKNLFEGLENEINAVKFNYELLSSLLPDGINEPIFLGAANNFYYVGFELENQNPKVEKWIDENNIIIDDLRRYGPTLNSIDGSFLALTNGMTFWHKTHKFCGTCGQINTSKEGGFVRVCSNTKLIDGGVATSNVGAAADSAASEAVAERNALGIWNSGLIAIGC